MMNKEQLDKIKQLHEMSEQYPEHKCVIDVELLRKGVPALIADVERLQRFKNYFDYLHGKGLEMANWHQNGNLELFDKFYEEAVNFMEKESCD